MFNMKLIKRILLIGWGGLLFFCLPGLLRAEDKRTMSLDLYLIVDGSSLHKNAKSETVAWIKTELIDRILQEGDSLTIWSAGDRVEILYSGSIGAQKDEAKKKLDSLDTSGKKSDFSGALREAAAKAAQNSQGGKRMELTMVVGGSAEALAEDIGGKNANLFRWSRVEVFSHWQVLVVDSTIGSRVRSAAAAYMAGI
jgi:hypothetical protein